MGVSEKTCVRESVREGRDLGFSLGFRVSGLGFGFGFRVWGLVQTKPTSSRYLPTTAAASSRTRVYLN